MFLATTGLTEFWDARDKLLLLGRWCLRPDTEREWRELSYTLLPYPWDHPATLEAGKSSCLALQETALKAFAHALNDIHGTSWSLRYWEIVLGPWLIYFAPAAVDRRTCLAKALEDHPDAATLAMDPKCFIVPTDINEFRARSLDDPYNLQLYSQILESLGRSPETRRRKQDNGGGRTSLSARTMRQKVKNGVKKLSPFLNRLAGSLSPAFLYQGYVPLARQLELFGRSGLRICPLATVPLNTDSIPEPDRTLRRDLEHALASRATGPVMETDLRLMARNLPRVYLEGYRKSRRFARKAFPARPKALVSAVAWFLNEPFKLHAAECAETGTRLVGIQHGGMYGYCETLPSERHEIRVLDRFSTWGWNQAGYATVPCGCGPLIKKIDHHADEKQSILLHVSTITPRYLELFYNQPLGPGYLDYMQDQFTLLNSLPESMAAKTLVRPYPFEYGWNHIQQFRERCPGVTIDDFSESFDQRLSKARMVVCGDIQTTFLQALSNDIPTVAFVNPDVWKIRPEAADRFQSLRNAGIVTHSPEEAVQRITSVFHDPEQWWRSPETRSALESFLDAYCRADGDWHACLARCVFD